MKLEDDRKRCVTIESRKHEHPLGSGTRQGWKPFRNPSPSPREMGGTTRRSSVQPFPNKTPHHTIDSIIRIAEIRGRSGGVPMWRLTDSIGPCVVLYECTNPDARLKGHDTSSIWGNVSAFVWVVKGSSKLELESR